MGELTGADYRTEPALLHGDVGGAGPGGTLGAQVGGREGRARGEPARAHLGGHLAGGRQQRAARAGNILAHLAGEHAVGAKALRHLRLGGLAPVVVPAGPRVQGLRHLRDRQPGDLHLGRTLPPGRNGAAVLRADPNEHGNVLGPAQHPLLAVDEHAPRLRHPLRRRQHP